MKNYLIFLLFPVVMSGQKTIRGQVVQSDQKPVEGVHVFLVGSYDGALTDSKGFFAFDTQNLETPQLQFSKSGYADLQCRLQSDAVAIPVYYLQELGKTLDEVVVQAGQLRTLGHSGQSVLSALDVLTTAGSAGNLVGALQTLPGAQVNGEDGRLLIRGGDASETQVFVNGLKVAHAYTMSAPNTPVRSRFSPLLFEGMHFSAGGYAAEFGNALSGILLLNTSNRLEADRADIGVSTVGLGAAMARKWKSNSWSFSGNYTNLAPYYSWVKQDVDWIRPYQSVAFESSFRKQWKRGFLKLFVAFESTGLELNQINLDRLEFDRVKKANHNLYWNGMYTRRMNNFWTFELGASLGYRDEPVNFNALDIQQNQTDAQLKAKAIKKWSPQIQTVFGVESFHQRYRQSFDAVSRFQFANTATAGFLETDFLMWNSWVLKAGIRAQYSNLLEKSKVEPRLSMTYQKNASHQWSVVYGAFSQLPSTEVLKYKPPIDWTSASHFIANYSYVGEGRLFRLETFYKSYWNLVKYQTADSGEPYLFGNLGSGRAFGLDGLWKDDKTFRNLKYWISYSLVDSRRDQHNYPYAVTPDYVAKHQVSLVLKYWIEALTSQLSLTNSLNSGRPFNNPNQADFMNGRTQPDNNLSLSWSYLMSPQKILYVATDNVLGSSRISGYEYPKRPDVHGVYLGREVVPAAKRFVFIGFFWTLSTDKKINQLNQL